MRNKIAAAVLALSATAGGAAVAVGPAMASATPAATVAAGSHMHPDFLYNG